MNVAQYVEKFDPVIILIICCVGAIITLPFFIYLTYAKNTPEKLKKLYPYTAAILVVIFTTMIITTIVTITTVHKDTSGFINNVKSNYNVELTEQEAITILDSVPSQEPKVLYLEDDKINCVVNGYSVQFYNVIDQNDPPQEAQNSEEKPQE